ncbi:hypothetical protein A9D14_05395 [Croceicoccus marinus]|uniref:Uncharacterized protein n=2 Tax=Croceicoccus marinus TaxID=450378 RepID=A0A1Z1FAJ4_9SPHN|nr:hypothetical protein A9D14_05395 [Croceicoccus marinus]
MTMRRLALTVLGIVIFLLGVLWTLQGLGFVGWPADSFMIGKRQWAYIGVLAMAAGLILVWIVRRRRSGR